jgi:lipopolysaccharide transport system ATP-binding protein
MADSLVRVEHVSKRYCKRLRRSLLYGLQDLGRELVGRPRPEAGALRRDEFWAVRDVSLELRRGECLGLIGHNGAGKTTLLKMLNGIVKPDEGRIEIEGRVGALIALQAGFNPVLTGRENIYVSGMVLGLTRREINAKLDEIIAFSELGDFIDAPVRSYSSGMQVRLGFSVAAQLEPDVLLIDEVLAVGDAGFRFKCLNRIAELLRRAAVIFVSHSVSQVAKVCNRAMVLDHGRALVTTDSVGEAIDRYHQVFDYAAARAATEDWARIVGVRAASKTRSVEFRPGEQDGLPRLAIDAGDTLTIDLRVDVDPSIAAFSVSFTIEDAEHRPVAQVLSRNLTEDFPNTERHEHAVRLTVPRLPLNKGRYAVHAVMKEADRQVTLGKYLCRYDNFLELRVVGPHLIGAAPIQLDARWEARPATEPVDAP